MTHGHEQIRNTRTIRLEDKSGLCSTRGLIRQGAGQCRAGGISADGTVAGLPYSVPDYGMACPSACTCTCTCTYTCTYTCTSTSNHEKGLACRRAQRSDPCGPPSHRQYLWGCPSSARRARCFLSICCHVEAVVGQDSGLKSTQCQIAMVVCQRVDHHSTALLPDNEMQSPLGSC